MELKGKRILLFSPEPWHGLHMSKHHLSQALSARGNSVFFLDPPVPANSSFSTEVVAGVTVVRYKHWFRGINRMPLWLNRWYYRRIINDIAARTGGAFDIIWCFDTSRMQSFPEGVGYKLLHLADYDILYIGQGLIPSASIVFTTSQVVADEVAGRTQARTINIGHAIDQRWMKEIDALVQRVPREPKNIVFMGQLAITYNDWEGFAEIVSKHPHLAFTFIGPYDPNFPDPAFHRLFAMPNATFTGLKAKDDLIPLVRDADILFFGFRSGTRAKERANPHKVLEYLSTGNVIVGSYTMEYAGGPELFRMAAEGANLNEAFDSTLAEHATMNSPLERERRIAFAKEHTMGRLIERIESELSA